MADSWEWVGKRGKGEVLLERMGCRQPRVFLERAWAAAARREG